MDLQIIDGLNPTVNFASRDYAPPHMVWGPRMIPDCQLFYVVKGEAELQLGLKKIKIGAGCCVFYGSESPHRLESLQDTDYYSVHFHLDLASPEPEHPALHIVSCHQKEMAREAATYKLILPQLGEIVFPHVFMYPGLEPLFLRLVTEYQKEYALFGWVMRAIMLELITHIIRCRVDESMARLPTAIEGALNAIHHQPERHWTVTQLASDCGYHPNHFTRLFKEEMGTTPKEYLLTERIKRAKHLLLSGERIEDISERLGYNSIHYFSNNFKSLTGLTPSEFRQQGRHP